MNRTEQENTGAVDHGPDAYILVIDDEEVVCRTAEGILGKYYKVTSCQDAREAIRIAANEQPALILLDINLIGMDGFEVLEELKRAPLTAGIPVMFITADEDRAKEARGLQSGAMDFIRKPFIPEILLQRSRRIIMLNRYQKDLKGEVRRQAQRAERLTMEMMTALSQTVDAKDHYTNGHSERVAAYAAEIGRRMGKSREEQKELYSIGLLHDIGKIGIPEEIINKTQKLTDKEFNTIKTHTVIGYEILKGIVDLPQLCQGARSHHERYNGKGYPDGLTGEEIPEVARIICVADCYDAMTSTRTYSKPKAQEVVRAEIERCSGSQFDPAVARVMLSMIDDDTQYIMNERTGGRAVWKGSESIWDFRPVPMQQMILPDLAVSMTATEKGKETDILPEWIMQIPGLDARQGVLNCGSAESYLPVLTVFMQSAPGKAEAIERFCKEADVVNYTIKVHALKSAARIVGADGLSDRALALENAGKAGDLETIRRDTGALLAAYRELTGKLSPLDEAGGELKEMSSGMRREAFQTIQEIAQSMDYGSMEAVLRDLKEYRLAPADADALGRIGELLLELNWDGIAQIARSVSE